MPVYMHVGLLASFSKQSNGLIQLILELCDTLDYQDIKSIIMIKIMDFIIKIIVNSRILLCTKRQVC